ncbi:hypothetical protein HDU98_002291 [Podochytrium sp. JEL0797]|nr:hypothetical protein HDU98_002291 [Podochytrium sp. JEL0797]
MAKTIPDEILQNAKGLGMLRVTRIGTGGSVRFGAGLVVKRIGNKWSAPSSIKTTGGGLGAQLKHDVVDFLLVLNTTRVVKVFQRGWDIQVGPSFEILPGPFADSLAPVDEDAECFLYAKHGGEYIPASLEGAYIMQGKYENEDAYGRGIFSELVLSGNVPQPKCSEELYLNLEKRINAETAAQFAQMRI